MPSLLNYLKVYCLKCLSKPKAIGYPQFVRLSQSKKSTHSVWEPKSSNPMFRSALNGSEEGWAVFQALSEPKKSQNCRGYC